MYIIFWKGQYQNLCTIIHLNGTMPYHLPLIIFKVAPSVNDLESPFYLGNGRDLIEGRLSHLQNYCRYVEKQCVRLIVHEHRNMWKIHAKVLRKSRQTELETDREYNSTKNLKKRQLVLMKNHSEKAFQPKYSADYQIIQIVNENTVIVVTPNGR